MAKIMLVGDAASMRMMIKKTLTQSGYSGSAEVQDGAEAVKEYGEKKPDVVIMDITMPDVDGLQALREIGGSDTFVKIVICTAMRREGMVVGAIKSGAKDFIVKPFNAERIVQTMNSISGK